MAQIWFHQSLITFFNTSFLHRQLTLVHLIRLKLIAAIAERIETSALQFRHTFTSYKAVRYKAVV